MRSPVTVTRPIVHSGRRGRATGGLLLIVLAVSIPLTGCGFLRRSPTPVEPTTADHLVVTLRAIEPNGAPPAADAMSAARQVLSDRLNAFAGSRPDIQVRADELVVTASGVDPDTLRRLVQPGQLELRKVLGTTSDAPPSAGAGAPAPVTGQPSGTGNAPLDAVRAKLGPAFDSGQRVVTAIGQGQIDPGHMDAQTVGQIAPFAALSGTEVAVLPVEMQYLLPTVTCRQLNERPSDALADPAKQAVACDDGDNTHTKYSLDVAKVVGTDLAGATAGNDPNMGGWVVTLKFTASGQAKWTALTQEAVQQGQNTAVAIVVDGLVISAPQIVDVITGDAVISGADIDEHKAPMLAAMLAHGALPVAFQIESLTR